MDNSTIIIRGAREHNLQNVDLEIPRNQLVVFTGVSGSGKSSLAFDTLYAEGQRRYVESLSSYARQFLGQMQKPDVDYLAGLSPSISIQQKTAGRNPRSTVGTITEIHDYLRVLYARIGKGHCTKCDREITAQTREQIIEHIRALPAGTKYLVLAPVIRGQKGEYKDLFADMLRRGYLRARVDGQVVRLTENLALDRRIKHNIEIVIDRLKNDSKVRPRLAEAVEHALSLGDGTLIVAFEDESPTDKPKGRKAATKNDLLLSAHYACTHCGISYEPPSPQMFSFNSPHGMCMTCDGLGESFTFDPDLLIPDQTLSFYKGAIPLVGAMRGMGKWRKHLYQGVANTLGIDLKKPWNKLPEQHKEWLLEGSGDRHITYEWKMRGGNVWKHGGEWEGIVPQLLSSFKKTAAGPRRMQLEKYMRVVRCPSCDGQRLNAQARSVRVGGKTMVELCSMPVGDVGAWLDPKKGGLEKALDPLRKTIAEEVLKELRGRVGFLLEVGLHYLTLDRTAPTLSGGEAQRIRLAGQIGCGLVGVLYILDEPSIGLHPRDNDRLLRSLEQLRDMGNTVLVVEHDEETMRAADHIVDFGPGPGVRGGQIVASGSYSDILKAKGTLTADYLSGRRAIEIPENRRLRTDARVRIEGATHHNLKNLTVEIPLRQFVCVTGVSGSGKSSLVNDILKEGLWRQLGRKSDDDESTGGIRKKKTVGAHTAMTGAEHIDKVIDIDQSPIGRTPRSNPATYIKVFDEIRTLFSQLPEAKARGYKPGRFSFNKPGGRCEACEGNGSNKLEMDFLADVWVTCPVCEGRRFNRETLQVRFKGKSIHDVLESDVQEALEHFENIPKVRTMLQTLHDVGLDYLKLGQPAPTLSGGEAQRIKLARELCKRSTGQTLYILDEPTTGLHFDDISKLLSVLHGFVEGGNSVVVIEHNLDVIKTADWLLDLGPEGGSGGGTLVCEGPPETIAKCAESFTGQALAPVLKPKRRAANKAKKRKATAKPKRLEKLTVQGAQQHNLKNLDVELPRDKMSLFCGPSGSGKTSLALDTIYAEGQRRYIESLSAYARQFLGQMQKPRVDHVQGLSPAISIEQKTTTKSPRSTVGTVTEVHDYLRVLYARLGTPYCPKCDIPVGTQSADEIIGNILALPEGTKLYLLAPLERRGQEKYQTLFDEARRSGFVRLRIDGTSYPIDDLPKIDHRRKHTVEVVVDRVIVRADKRTRMADSVEAALDVGRGVLHVAHVNPDKDEPKWRVDRYSQHYACDKCGQGFEPLEPQHFSFNSPIGWCKACEGLGFQKGANPSLLIRDDALSLLDGAIAVWPDLNESPDFRAVAQGIAKHSDFSLETPYRDLEPAQQRKILHGTGNAWIPIETPDSRTMRFQYKGLYPAIDEASRVSVSYRQKLDHLVSQVACTACSGSRVRPDAAACRFEFANSRRLTLGELCDLSLADSLALFEGLNLSKEHQSIAGELLREIRDRLAFLVNVGLDYITLSRPAPTLSGGESQRIRLASQIGSGLTGVLYVLDEPTIGLHPRDNARLLQALQHLRDLGNTLVVVEHDREVIESADHVLDFGPGAGDQGGEVTAKGSPKQILRSKKSLTGDYLSGKKFIPVPTNRRIDIDEPSLPPDWPTLRVLGARQHNLRNVEAAFPLGAFVTVTGVSGSGKSSLVNEVLYQTLARKLHRARTPAAAHDEIVGIDQIDKVINVDQSPIGNSPKSNPATYTGVFDLVRQLFTQLPDSKVRGYRPQRFSFNKPGGRCEACEGNGQQKIEMHFLPDVWVDCETCNGERYNPETLAVKYKGHSIADVLRLRVHQALELFSNLPKIRHILQTLDDVGLGYIALGQSAPTLSGGEAQRVKLAAELSRPSTGRTFYILDEPTTGLHFDDIHKLLEVLHRLVDLGNTVLVVEHNLDVIKTADWIIDLGPDAGPAGGQIVAEGTPEDLVGSIEDRREDDSMPTSHTAIALGPVLEAGPFEERTPFDPFAKETTNEDDIDLGDVGKDASMPWQIDGQRWHTLDRVTTDGKPCRWEGKILTWIDEEVRKLGEFGPTKWNDRSVVEIPAKTKSQGWFLHSMTSQEWLLRLVFRVSKKAFTATDLIERLGILPLNQTEGLETYGMEERVRVTNHAKGPWQSVTVLVHWLKEIDTPEFKEFLAEASKSFHANIQRLQTKPEDLMPWKINGEAWHLSTKGFRPRKKIRWDPALITHLIDLVRKVEPNIDVKWDARDAVTLKLPGVGRGWARLATKENEALECRFLGKKGQFNLTQLEGLGIDPTINDSRSDSDTLTLKFRLLDQKQSKRLQELLAEHARGFLEVYDTKGAA